MYLTEAQADSDQQAQPKRVMEKVGMIGILNNPASSWNSHSAGWNRIMQAVIADQLGSCDILTEQDDWLKYDRLIINHGVNFREGIFNVVGGVSDEVIWRANKLIDYVIFGTGFVNQIDGFQFDDFLKKRNIDLAGIGEIPKIEFNSYDKTLVGDSHSISVWPGIGWNIHRMDGKTLYGFLKNPSYADMYYFGNIDIRFHLARQKDPLQATLDLVGRYIEHAKDNNAKVVCLLPVESESRKIPGSGKYKGQPFYGSQKLRQELVDVFNEELLMSGLPVRRWPQEWYDDPIFFQNEVMEPRQSVHLRPKFYANKL